MLVSRGVAMLALHCSRGKVRALERAGELAAQRDARGVVWFAEATVAAAASKHASTEAEHTARRLAQIPIVRRREPSADAGALAARVFALLAERKSLAEIVIRLSVEPWHVRELAEEYARTLERSAQEARDARVARELAAQERAERTRQNYDRRTAYLASKLELERARVELARIEAAARVRGAPAGAEAPEPFARRRPAR